MALNPWYGGFGGMTDPWSDPFGFGGFGGGMDLDIDRQVSFLSSNPIRYVSWHGNACLKCRGAISYLVCSQRSPTLPFE